ncbi:MAG: DUF2666 family protein [archaeon]
MTAKKISKSKKGEVKFHAKIGDWICVKKGKFEEDTDPMEAAKLLASIYDSFKRKIWDYTGEELDLDELDEIAYDITGAEYDDKKDEYRIKGRISNETMTEALQDLKNKVPRRIDIKNKELREIAKTYVTRKTLELLKIRIEPEPDNFKDYAEKKRKGMIQRE